MQQTARHARAEVLACCRRDAVSLCRQPAAALRPVHGRVKTQEFLQQHGDSSSSLPSCALTFKRKSPIWHPSIYGHDDVMTTALSQGVCHTGPPQSPCPSRRARSFFFEKCSKILPLVASAIQKCTVVLFFFYTLGTVFFFVPHVTHRAAGSTLILCQSATIWRRCDALSRR